MASLKGQRSARMQFPNVQSSPTNSSGSESESHEVTIFGKNGLFNDVYDNLFNISAPDEGKFDAVADEIYMAGRPTNFLNRMLKATTFWQPYALMDWYMSEVSILATIKSRSVKE